jgi:hypothetical protein
MKEGAMPNKKIKRDAEVEVVIRPSRRKRMFGGPESILGAAIQKDLDAMVLEDMFALRDGPKTGGSDGSAKDKGTA